MIWCALDGNSNRSKKRESEGKLELDIRFRRLKRNVALFNPCTPAFRAEAKAEGRAFLTVFFVGHVGTVHFSLLVLGSDASLAMADQALGAISRGFVFACCCYFCVHSFVSVASRLRAKKDSVLSFRMRKSFLRPEFTPPPKCWYYIPITTTQ